MLEKINSIFDLHQIQKIKLRSSSIQDRIEKLRLLKRAIQKHEEEIFIALHKDLRKNKFEAAVTEVYFIYGEIDFALKNLKNWAKPKSAPSNMANLLANNKIYYEPKGACLIISPWNYPIQLVFSPLISAIAAGNCAIIKPSEISFNTSLIIEQIIQENFPINEITCINGGTEVSTELLKLPFDHIFFTGSTTIGKIVMEAAAKNLTSVTLELGGKSPVIIDKTANLKTAAEKIAWGKLVNAGQTCIAPDYVYIDKDIKDEFVALLISAIKKLFYKNDNEVDYSNYVKIINENHFLRLKNLIKNANDEGARIEFGGQYNPNELSINPTILSEVNTHHNIMKDEIFGPILPILTYSDLDEAINHVNSKEKPLALYIFSSSKQNQNRIIKETSSGGTCVNDVLIHISNPNAPFGGVNHSGLGSCHGIFGFKAFSHERTVLFQSKIDLTKLVYPPYAPKMNILKWLKKIM